MEETFGHYINKLRVEHKLTLTKLAAALDLDQSTLSKIENNKRNVPEEILPKLSKVFNIDLKIIEKEFYSEKIANMIYLHDNSDELLKLASRRIEILTKKTKLYK